ncbi:hypothetical protein EJ08DRAFT_727993 [Tothia fuscella]|uniref:Uncharacterized protein n=1 Tax=Tothia fuscella TaxID=1048955 RepID=A0A9P4NGW8_9PEZI|nr:hypothetical protein EJ08DRAFT_727993 [Tothia fuscella]
MFVLQTTILVLLAFLAICAYEIVTYLFNERKGRSRLSMSPSLSPTTDTKEEVPPDNQSYTLKRSAQDPVDPVDEQMEADKELYYKLHNLEFCPEILPQCQERLNSLLAETLSKSIEKPLGTILGLEVFSATALEGFLRHEHDAAGKGYDEYIQRRRNGGAREMFADADEAKWWLKQAAPVKYVDGAWLGHINKISTPFNTRYITKNAWQVMSEELGDGDLSKNHVHVYRALMQKIGAKLPEADAKDFIDQRNGLTVARCWKAALAQLLISLFPHEYLPEILGFNMAYESLPLHLMKTVKELDELKINSYYFTLHISIDNADSGHAAMAMLAVTNYIDLVRRENGEEAAYTAWRRVQAGYTLAEGLPTTPVTNTMKSNMASGGSQPFPRTKEEAEVLIIFRAKAPVAHQIHCNSRLKIGKHTLVEWLDPKTFDRVEEQEAFFEALANRKPWVIKGDSSKSRLITELSWEGRMFGSFTDVEVEILKRWIDSLGASRNSPRMAGANVYFEFVGGRDKQDSPRSSQPQDVFVDYPVFSKGHSHLVPGATLSHEAPNEGSLLTPQTAEGVQINGPDTKVHDMHSLLPIWFASCSLLEAVPNVPVRCASTIGSAIVKVLRAQYGFETEGLGVAGIDELHRTNEGDAIGLVEIGLQLWKITFLDKAMPKDLSEVMAIADDETVTLARRILQLSMAPKQNTPMLLGLSQANLELHEIMLAMDVAIPTPYRDALRAIVTREKKHLELCHSELERDELLLAEYDTGYAMGVSEFRKCIYMT